MKAAEETSDVKIIKDWLKKQPHLPQDLDDHFLKNFLKGCKFSLEKCKKKLDMYFTLKTALPHFFNDRNIHRQEVQEMLEVAFVICLPFFTPKGQRIMMVGTTETGFEYRDIRGLFKIIYMEYDLILNKEEVSDNGDIVVIDCSSALPKYFNKVPLVDVKKFFICVQQAYPVRLKEIHLVNVSPFVEFVLNVVKSVLSEKIRKRIKIHHSLQSLHEAVSRKILPEEFGGVNGSVKDYQNEWIKKFEEHSSWFKEQENVKADESKRIGKSWTYEDLFGIEGSFKQLNID